MANHIIVSIAVERIVNKGLNPKTGRTYILDDITNEIYRSYIIRELVEVYGWELDADDIQR
ncbi:hypothetical protein [Lysinibacillus pakistanensis]|uniref:Uncharacterized protein n=1 Tax=Lysinibacillus pakistanensis TaxID=759811 RepID=A0AAX3X218_9BACI|nr:hypothetical protein [Lysinibacillus pakistanensis]MDM5232585.1 hypothetical protein [Lysinibacillus pakistanensis]WHY48091.1 hypothetical protein QNH22_07645 [Lysinibacillus pakistanensis]WHY53103.1 hypothetical protein QNH24_07630 [Lysinibacillus pakistanensis]